MSERTSAASEICRDLGGTGQAMGQAGGFSTELQKLTPGLRRYARALTGGATEAADELVQSALQTALDETRFGETRFHRPGDLRIELYSIFTYLARRKMRGAPSLRPSLRQPVIVHGLADLALEEREALLLVALEGFTYDEISRITNVERPAVLMRLARARAALTELDHRPSSDGSRRVAPHLRIIK